MTVQTTVEVPQLLEVPLEIPQVQFLDKFDTPVTRVFFDKVVDGPVVLCNGVPQVQFIEGYDVPMIHVLRSAPHLAA